MTEKLLQFIWKNRYFNQQELRLVSGEPLSIEYPGDLNSNQGPDFLQARIRIEGTCWVGSVELHLFSSGWDKHGHETDDHYRNVILHVIWKQDRAGTIRNIPQLELCQRVSGLMLTTFAGWMHRYHFVPCEHSLGRAEPGVWKSWKENLLTRRLTRKMASILGSLAGNHQHWEEQLWWMLAWNFGLTVNAAVFETVARSIPYVLLARHRHNHIQLEALLFGQANLLAEDFKDPYAVLLKKEFRFLKTKYRLREAFEQVHFLRMRPDNFPTIRLSQLGALFRESSQLFAWLLQCRDLAEVRRKFRVTANDYWCYHYVFDKPSPFREKTLGSSTIDSIIINSVIPLLYTYGETNANAAIRARALDWMQRLPAERNNGLNHWKSLNVPIRDAAASQALMELKKTFCEKHKCLDCEIGKYLLKSGWSRPDAESAYQTSTTDGQL
jgi:hypothetical protein